MERPGNRALARFKSRSSRCKLRISRPLRSDSDRAAAELHFGQRDCAWYSWPWQREFFSARMWAFMCRAGSRTTGPRTVVVSSAMLLHLAIGLHQSATRDPILPYPSIFVLDEQRFAANISIGSLSLGMSGNNLGVPMPEAGREKPKRILVEM